jgi:methionyl-tRNA formyltransferase
MTLPVDSGPILAQQAIRLTGRSDTEAAKLYEELAALVPDMLARVLSEIGSTRRISGKPQSSADSFRDFPWREPEQLELDFSQPASEVIRRARVFPDNVNLHVGRRRIFFTSITEVVRPPGTIVRKRLRTLDVVAADQRTIRLVLNRPIRAWVKLLLVGFRLRPREQKRERKPTGSLADDLMARLVSLKPRRRVEEELSRAAKRV